MKVKPVIVIPGPLAAFSSSTPACSGLADHLYRPEQCQRRKPLPPGTGISAMERIPPIMRLSRSFEHTYAQPGTFQVTLHVLSALGCEHAVQHTVTISPSPIAGFDYANTCQGQSTQFTDMTSLNGGSSLTQRAWNFGDPASGMLNTSTLTNPIHNFANPGSTL